MGFTRRKLTRGGSDDGCAAPLIPWWRRWRPVLRLRTLMAFILLICVGLGWIAGRVRVERQAVAAIRHAGGFADRGHRRTPTGNLLPNAPNPAPAWVLRWVPEECFQTVNFVGLRGPKVDDAMLARIAGMHGVEELDLSESMVTDAGLAHLRRMKNLKALHLDKTRISDAGLLHIQGLDRLEFLDLSGTNITDFGLAHLSRLRQLRILNVEETRIGDAGLAHLAGMDKLFKLLLAGTNVSASGLNQLASHRGLVSLRLPSQRVGAETANELRKLMPKLTYVLFR